MKKKITRKERQLAGVKYYKNRKEEYKFIIFFKRQLLHKFFFFPAKAFEFKIEEKEKKNENRTR